MALSNEQKARLLDTLDGSFISLHTSDPGETGDGEIAGSGYVRQPAVFTPAKDGVKKLLEEAKFENLRGCTITHFGLSSNKTGDGFLVGGKLLTPRTLLPGDGFKFKPGSISFGAE